MEAIYYDWSTSSWGTRASDGKNERRVGVPRTPIKDPPNTSEVHCETHANTRNPSVQFEKRTHTSDTRESLRLDGIISASLFPFRVLLKLRPVPAPRYEIRLSLSHSIHSWLWIWMNSERAFPSRNCHHTWELERATTARVATSSNGNRQKYEMSCETTYSYGQRKTGYTKSRRQCNNERI